MQGVSISELLMKMKEIDILGILGIYLEWGNDFTYLRDYGE